MRHQTIHKELKNPIRNMRKMNGVKKIIVGPYSNCRHKYTPGTLSFKNNTNNGFKMFGYDGSGVMTFYVYTDLKKREDIITSF